MKMIGIVGLVATMIVFFGKCQGQEWSQSWAAYDKSGQETDLFQEGGYIYVTCDIGGPCPPTQKIKLTSSNGTGMKVENCTGGNYVWFRLDFNSDIRFGEYKCSYEPLSRNWGNLTIRYFIRNQPADHKPCKKGEMFMATENAKDGTCSPIDPSWCSPTAPTKQRCFRANETCRALANRGQPWTMTKGNCEEDETKEAHVKQKNTLVNYGGTVLQSANGTMEIVVNLPPGFEKANYDYMFEKEDGFSGACDGSTCKVQVQNPKTGGAPKWTDILIKVTSENGKERWFWFFVYWIGYVFITIGAGTVALKYEESLKNAGFEVELESLMDSANNQIAVIGDKSVTPPGANAVTYAYTIPPTVAKVKKAVIRIVYQEYVFFQEIEVTGDQTLATLTTSGMFGSPTAPGGIEKHVWIIIASAGGGVVMIGVVVVVFVVWRRRRRRRALQMQQLSQERKDEIERKREEKEAQRRAKLEEKETIMYEQKAEAARRKLIAKMNKPDQLRYLLDKRKYHNCHAMIIFVKIPEEIARILRPDIPPEKIKHISASKYCRQQAEAINRTRYSSTKIKMDAVAEYFDSTVKIRKEVMATAKMINININGKRLPRLAKTHTQCEVTMTLDPQDKNFKTFPLQDIDVTFIPDISGDKVNHTTPIIFPRPGEKIEADKQGHLLFTGKRMPNADLCCFAWYHNLRAVIDIDCEDPLFPLDTRFSVEYGTFKLVNNAEIEHYHPAIQVKILEFVNRNGFHDKHRYNFFYVHIDWKAVCKDYGRAIPRLLDLIARLERYTYAKYKEKTDGYFRCMRNLFITSPDPKIEATFFVAMMLGRQQWLRWREFTNESVIRHMINYYPDAFNTDDKMRFYEGMLVLNTFMHEVMTLTDQCRVWFEFMKKQDELDAVFEEQWVKKYEKMFNLVREKIPTLDMNSKRTQEWLAQVPSCLKS